MKQSQKENFGREQKKEKRLIGPVSNNIQPV
jgi:hypothetical protein